MKLLNPYWKDAITTKAETHKPAVLAWLTANAGNRFVTMNELRAGLPGIAGDLTRPVVQEICSQAGIAIESADTSDV
jgi:hypothetical protein